MVANVICVQTIIENVNCMDFYQRLPKIENFNERNEQRLMKTIFKTLRMLYN